MSQIRRTSEMNRKQRLKQLIEEGEEIKSTTTEDMERIDKINKILKESESIINEGDLRDFAKNTLEVVMDAQIMKMSHELFGEVMQNVTNLEFSDDDYCNSIRKVVFKEDEDWNELTKIAIGIAYTTKFSNCLLGIIDDEIINDNSTQNDNEIQTKKRRSRNKIGKESQPESVKELEKQDEGAKKVNQFFKQIRKIYNRTNEPIPYYKLIIDPTDFMNTIDNAFQVAFLVRDNKLLVKCNGDDDDGNDDEDNLPVIIPIGKNDQHDENSIRNSNDTLQSVSTFNLNLINRMIKKYNIKRKLIVLE